MLRESPEKEGAGRMTFRRFFPFVTEPVSYTHLTLPTTSRV